MLKRFYVLLHWVRETQAVLKLILTPLVSLFLPPSLFLPFARSSTRSQWKRVIQGLALQKAALKLEARQNKQMQQIYALELTHADETDWKHFQSRRWFGAHALIHDWPKSWDFFYASNKQGWTHLQ